MLGACARLRRSTNSLYSEVAPFKLACDGFTTQYECVRNTAIGKRREETELGISEADLSVGEKRDRRAAVVRNRG